MSRQAPPPLDDFHWALRTEVYRHFGATAHAPTLDALTAWSSRRSAEVLETLEALEANHHLALLPDRSGIWMAHPFSAAPTDFPVDTPRGRFWANCAWDALGVPAILGVDGWTEVRCAATGIRLGYGVKNGRRVGDDGVIHLVVPPRRAWDDIGFT
jgi:hypothetical protein